MRKIYILIMLLLVPSVVTAEAPEGYPFLSYDEGMRIAQQKNKRLFVYFGRYGCGWCDLTNKQAFSDPGIREIFTQHYVLAYVDAESGKRLTLPSGERITEMELGARLNVFATPVFIYMEPDGKILLQAPGVKTIDDFKQFHTFIHDEYYKKQSFSEFLGKQMSRKK
jgi:thioredoxin-related protein